MLLLTVVCCLLQCQANSEAARDCNKRLESLAAKMSEEGDQEGEWWWREDVARIMGDARKTDLAHGPSASTAELEDFKQKLDEIKGCEGDVGEAALLGIELIDQKVLRAPQQTCARQLYSDAAI